MNVTHHRILTATLIFDLEDHYQRQQGHRGLHPRPIEPVTFWLAGQMVNGQRQNFDPPLPMITVRNASGYHLFFGCVKQTRGPDRRLSLTDGTYIVRVESALYQTVERTDIVLPMPNPNDPAAGAPYQFDLEPNYAYPFPNSNPLRLEGVQPQCGGSAMLGGRGPTLLRGTLHTPTGQGLVGAMVEVAGRSNIYHTDATGQWVLWFPDDQPTGMVTIRVTPPENGIGGPIVAVPNVCVVAGRETSLFETALHGWVQRAGIGVRGASVTIADAGLLGSTTTEEDGRWAYYFDLLQAQTTVNVTSTLPDNSATLTTLNVPVRPRATVMIPTFRFV